MQPGDIHFAAVVKQSAAGDGGEKKVIVPFQCALAEAADVVDLQLASLPRHANLKSGQNEIDTSALGQFSVFSAAMSGPSSGLVVVGTKNWRCSSNVIAFIRRVQAEVARDPTDFGFWHLRSLVWRAEEHDAPAEDNDAYAMQPRLFEGRDWYEQEEEDLWEEEDAYQGAMASPPGMGGEKEQDQAPATCEGSMRQSVSSQNANDRVLETFPSMGQQSGSPAAAGGAAATAGASPPSTAGDGERGVSPAHVEGWDPQFFKSNFGGTPPALNSRGASPHFPRKTLAEDLSFPVSGARVEGSSSTQPSPAARGGSGSGGDQNLSPASHFADFANFSASPRQGLAALHRASSDPSNGAASVVTAVASAAAAAAQHAPSILPTVPAAEVAPAPAIVPGASGVSPPIVVGLAQQQQQQQQPAAMAVPTVAAPTPLTYPGSKQYLQVRAVEGGAFGGTAQSAVMAAGSVGETPMSENERVAADYENRGGSGDNVGAAQTRSQTAASNDAEGNKAVAAAAAAAGSDPAQVVSLAASEDVAYIHRGSTLERYAVSGSVLVSASGTPARLRVTDPRGHIALVNANAAVAEQVTTGVALPTREYLCKTAGVAAAVAGAKFLPAISYRCSPAVKILPARVTCKLRTAGSAVLVWAQVIANPQISQPLSGVSVLVHLPFSPRQDEAGVKSEPQALWKPDRRVLEWNLPSGIKPGDKQIMQARLTVEDREVRAGAMPQTAPSMVRCHILESTFSSVGLEVASVGGVGNAEVLGNVVRRCRVQCKQHG